jgi:hypothetical protein
MPALRPQPMCGKAFDRLGPLEADALIQQVSDGLKAKLGHAGTGCFGGG